MLLNGVLFLLILFITQDFVYASLIIRFISVTAFCDDVVGFVFCFVLFLFLFFGRCALISKENLTSFSTQPVNAR